MTSTSHQTPKPPAELDLTGEDMARAREAAARLPAGAEGARVGLGLAIVRGIVEAHGGDVSVHNGTGGCTFVVALRWPPDDGWLPGDA
jgi:signal transduction histidine kinase